MLALDYLSIELPPAHVNQTPEEILNSMQLADANHIAIFNDSEFMGNLSRDALEVLPPDKPLIKALNKLDLEPFKLTENATLFDAINLYHIHNSNVIPLFNKEEKYLGNIFMEEVISALSKLPFISEPAAIMIVRIPTKKYSLSEVAKIIESNNARLLGALIYKFNTDYIEVMVKLATDNLTSVGETFERFGYTVAQKFFTDEKEIFLKDRFDHFMKFLDI